jgi:hypothetical protein
MNALQKALAFLRQNWVSTAALLAAIWAYAGPSVHNFITNHPKYSFAFGLVSVIVAFYMRSPLPSQGGIHAATPPPKPPAPPNVR